MKFYFAALIGADETPSLLSSCIQYTQVMRLNRGSAVDSLCETIADRQRTKRAFWFLYSIEKEFCLHAEICPVRFQEVALLNLFLMTVWLKETR